MKPQEVALLKKQLGKETTEGEIKNIIAQHIGVEHIARDYAKNIIIRHCIEAARALLKEFRVVRR